MVCGVMGADVNNLRIFIEPMPAAKHLKRLDAQEMLCTVSGEVLDPTGTGPRHIVDSVISSFTELAVFKA